MSEADFHTWLLRSWFVLAGVCFAVLWVIPAPYGRQDRPGWGPEIPARWAWLIMEAPAVLVPLLCFFYAGQTSFSTLLLLGMWLVHYGQRTFIYPFRMRMVNRKMPLLIAGLAFVTNIGVNYLIWRWHFTLAPTSTNGSPITARFVVGLGLFGAGLIINIHSDEILRRLRRPKETGYKIPEAGLYRWVSCPNYLGELIEWGGFALASASAPGFLFWVWSLSNLVPRARSHHRWYRARFPDYPRKRRALVPGLW